MKNELKEASINEPFSTAEGQSRKSSSGSSNNKQLGHILAKVIKRSSKGLCLDRTRREKKGAVAADVTWGERALFTTHTVLARRGTEEEGNIFVTHSAATIIGTTC